METQLDMFGSHALQGWRSRLHRAAMAMPRHWAGKQARSAAWRLALAGWGRPVDAVLPAGTRMRLYPYDNLTDKHLFADPAHWDGRERQAIGAEIALMPAGRAIGFVDVGANVGAYSCAAVSMAAAAGRTIRVLAIEPGARVRERMIFNLRASGYEDAVTVLAAAIGPRGTGWELSVPGTNLGQTRLVPSADIGNEIPVTGLGAALAQSGFEAPDILKIDIEGLESVVLDDYFNAVAPSALPRLIIAETRGGKTLEIAERCAAAGFERLFDNGRNGVFRRLPAAETTR